MSFFKMKIRAPSFATWTTINFSPLLFRCTCNMCSLKCSSYIISMMSLTYHFLLIVPWSQYLCSRAFYIEKVTEILPYWFYGVTNGLFLLFVRDTYIKLMAGESPNDRNDRGMLFTALDVYSVYLIQLGFTIVGERKSWM